MPENIIYMRETQHSLRRMMITLSVFVLAVFLILGYLVGEGGNAYQRLCEQRRDGVIRSNDTWDSLVAIEKRDPNTSDAVRYQRIEVYLAAKGPIPECNQ